MLQQEVFALASKHLKKIRRVGNDNISAICPFHVKQDGSEERSPSFSMSLSKGVWHCFTCQMSGTFHTFLRDVGYSKAIITMRYGEILDALRKTHSPTFDPIRPNVVEEDPLPEAMLGLFEKCPTPMIDPTMALELDPKDPITFDEELLQKYDVGFDDKHMRITFPLRDLWGNLMGVSGRTVNNAYPRYKVYDKDEYVTLGYGPRGPAKKGSILWNAHKVYPSVFLGEPGQFVLLVEGFRGCLWAIQSGVKNTMALLGSSLSKQQRWILERMGCRVYLMLDNDEAGRRALRGTVENGQKRPGIAEQLVTSLDVSIVEYKGKQPTMLTQEELCGAVNNAPDYYQWVSKKEN